jgi:hypothetical protein
MKSLEKEIRKIIGNELARACELHGYLNNSLHESYAIILKELQEAAGVSAAFDHNLNVFWAKVKANAPEDLLSKILLEMQTFSLHAAMEWVQVAAMCEKANLSTISNKGKEPAT